MNKLFRRHETWLAVAIVVLALGFGIAAPRFFSLLHLFGIARSTVVIGLMALGLLTVLIAGGIDVSVSATAVASMYITVVALAGVGYEGPVIVAMLLALLVGAAFGSVNAVLVSLLRLPALIVTLGTLTLYRGALLAFVGTDRIRALPAQLSDFAVSSVFELTVSERRVSLHVVVLIFLVIAALLGWALRSTGWGRGVYAIGGNEEAARRLGLPVVRIRVTTFALAGALAGLAGLLSAALNRAADPFTIVGSELDVLAAVVLGGASISGGRGTVLGTVLGILLVTLLGSSLVLVGIPTAWRQAFVGLFLLLGVGLPAWRERRLERRRGLVVSA